MHHLVNNATNNNSGNSSNGSLYTSIESRRSDTELQKDMEQINQLFRVLNVICDTLQQQNNHLSSTKN